MAIKVRWFLVFCFHCWPGLTSWPIRRNQTEFETNKKVIFRKEMERWGRVGENQNLNETERWRKIQKDVTSLGVCLCILTQIPDHAIKESLHHLSRSVCPQQSFKRCLTVKQEKHFLSYWFQNLVVLGLCFGCRTWNIHIALCKWLPALSFVCLSSIFFIKDDNTLDLVLFFHIIGWTTAYSLMVAGNIDCLSSVLEWCSYSYC